MKSKRSTIVLLTGLALGVGLGIALNLGGVGRFGLLSDARAEGAVKAASPVEPVSHRDVYYPGSETLGPDEMRVIACGTGMPTTRAAQAAACFLVELGNGDKFIFDIGSFFSVSHFTIFNSFVFFLVYVKFSFRYFIKRNSLWVN